jgi:hypothetical protein
MGSLGRLFESEEQSAGQQDLMRSRIEEFERT